MSRLDLERVRLGLVGTGSVVETYHLPALKSLPNVNISWVCDRDPLRAKWFGSA